MGTFTSKRSTGPLSTRSRWLALLTAAIVAVVIIGVLVSACGGTLGSTDSSNAQATGDHAATSGSTATTAPSANNASSATTTPTVQAQGEASPAWTVAKILGPSVVNIKVTGTTSGNGTGSVAAQQFAAEGSGVIYRADGMIITNNHVVSESQSGIDHEGDAADWRATRRDHRRQRSPDRRRGHQGEAQGMICRSRQFVGQLPERGRIRRRHR